MIEQLIDDHRRVEPLLERLIHHFTPEAFRAAHAALTEHYVRECGLLALLATLEPELAAKMETQHAEVEEIARELLRSLDSGPASDVEYLTRRFCALALHNIGEEERDVYPLLSATSAPDYDEKI